MCDTQIEWFDGMRYKDLIIEVDADWPYILCADCSPDPDIDLEAVNEVLKEFDETAWEEVSFEEN